MSENDELPVKAFLDCWGDPWRDRSEIDADRVADPLVLLSDAQRIRDERDRLRWLLRRIVEDLPSNRDWLDPAVESAARQALAGAKE